MGMGVSVSPQIWQQFINLIFQDDIIKRKQNFDVIMDDTSHWVDNLYVHKTKDYDMMQVKRKHGRPPKQNTRLDITQTPAANTSTV